jgi:membrane protease YdiL (CAAX protease family)
MDPLLRSTLLKVALPLVTISVVLLITRLRGISWRDDLALRWPKPSVALFWLGLWIGWMVAGEVAVAVFGLEQPKLWPDYPLLIVALRIAAIGLLGPAAEEIVVRGLAFFRLQRTRLGPWGAIVLCSALWAAAHVQYDWTLITLIFCDGLVLGAARYRSGSTFLPVAMHVMGNLYSIYQSLSG